MIRTDELWKLPLATKAALLKAMPPCPGFSHAHTLRAMGDNSESHPSCRAPSGICWGLGKTTAPRPASSFARYYPENTPRLPAHYPLSQRSASQRTPPVTVFSISLPEPVFVVVFNLKQIQLHTYPLRSNESLCLISSKTYLKSFPHCYHL